MKNNHSILGLHMMGNEAKVDQLGFVEGKINEDQALSHVFTRIPGSPILFKLQPCSGALASRASSS